MGLLLARRTGGPRGLLAAFKGEVARKDTSLLSAAFSARPAGTRHGVAGQYRERGGLAPRTGIELTEERSTEIGDFSSMMTAEVKTEQGSMLATGTLFGNNMPRLVQIGDCRLESYLDGVLMVFVHRDMPGGIGQVGNIFGRHRINIAQMSVGRAADKPGGEAIGILALDARPPAKPWPGLAIATVTRAWIVNCPPPGQARLDGTGVKKSLRHARPQSSMERLVF